MVNYPPPEPSAHRGITYRTAKPEDGVALRQYLVQVFTETDFLSQSAQDPPMSETQVAQTIAQAAEGPNQLLLLAVFAGSIVGMLRFKGGLTRRTRHTGEVGITVLKAHWGRGAATGLLTRFLNWAAHGRLIRQINLRVRPDNERALALYRRYCFTETGRMERDLCIDGRFYDHLLMGLAIDPAAPQPPEQR